MTYTHYVRDERIARRWNLWHRAAHLDLVAARYRTRCGVVIDDPALVVSYDQAAAQRIVDREPPPRLRCWRCWYP